MAEIPSGVYVYRILAGEYVESRKMLYINSDIPNHLGHTQPGVFKWVPS